MAITIDWINKRVQSTTSILDIVAHHDELRGFEESAQGMLFPPIISYKVLDLGGGSSFVGLDYINGYTLIFPNAGNYVIIGNIGAAIVPVAGVFVDRTKAAAFATVSGAGGGGGATIEQIEASLILAKEASVVAAVKAAKLAAALSA